MSVTGTESKDLIIQAIYSQNQHLQSRMEELKSSMHDSFDAVNHKFISMSSNMKQIASRPFSRKNRFSHHRKEEDIDIEEQDECSSNTPTPLPYLYTLRKNPRTLENLWNEYEFGVGGRLAAKKFTSVQKGKVKCIYCLCKIVWDCIQSQCNRGHTAQAACNNIYKVYGAGTTVTNITKKLTNDKRAGSLHVDLEFLCLTYKIKIYNILYFNVK